MNDKNALSPSLVETIAGFTAGVVSTLAVHPLDIVKTRLQGEAQSHSYTSLDSPKQQLY